MARFMHELAIALILMSFFVVIASVAVDTAHASMTKGWTAAFVALAFGTAAAWGVLHLADGPRATVNVIREIRRDRTDIRGLGADIHVPVKDFDGATLGR
jgi:hypothetical protein